MSLSVEEVAILGARTVLYNCKPARMVAAESFGFEWGRGGRRKK